MSFLFLCNILTLEKNIGVLNRYLKDLQKNTLSTERLVGADLEEESNF